jgi:CubicO group peptidase (beta-lactamase class C family)
MVVTASVVLLIAGVRLTGCASAGSRGASEEGTMNRKLDYFALLLVLCCAVWVVSCAPEPGHVYQIPEQTNDGWATASLDDVGMNKELLGELIERIDRKEYRNVHGILIVKNGKLVFEEYYEGYEFAYSGPWSSALNFRGKRTDFGIDTPHNLASVTKSFTSALVGIAIDRGHIRDVDEPVFSYLPDYSHLSNEQKDRITLEHLLTMTSGLKWNELELWLGDMEHDLIQLFLVPDPMSYILAKTVVDEPGTAWYYNGGAVNVLGEVIREASGLRMNDFAERVLFAPLGITEYEWDHISSDMIHASGNLKLRPRDTAKFGYLYLNGGRWQGQQILSSEWIAASMRESVSIPWSSLAGNLHEKYAEIPETHGDGYGYLWKTRRCGSGNRLGRSVDRPVSRSGHGGCPYRWELCDPRTGSRDPYAPYPASGAVSG